MVQAPQQRLFSDNELVTHTTLNQQMHDQIVNSAIGLATTAGQVFVAKGPRELEVINPPSTGKKFYVCDSSGVVTQTLITSALIAQDAVTNAKVANNAITTAKIADGAVTSQKLSSEFTLGTPTRIYSQGSSGDDKGFWTTANRFTTIHTPKTGSNDRKWTTGVNTLTFLFGGIDNSGDTQIETGYFSLCIPALLLKDLGNVTPNSSVTPSLIHNYVGLDFNGDNYYIARSSSNQILFASSRANRGVILKLYGS